MTEYLKSTYVSCRELGLLTTISNSSFWGPNALLWPLLAPENEYTYACTRAHTVRESEKDLLEWLADCGLACPAVVVQESSSCSVHKPRCLSWSSVYIGIPKKYEGMDLPVRAIRQ